MVFSSVTFLFFFLPLVIAAYYVAPRSLRNFVLAAASIVFYVWGTGSFAVVLVASIAINFVVGWLLGREEPDTRRTKALLAVAVVLNVGLLIWFKYTNFAVTGINDALGWLGIGSIPWTNILLPIGISFFTFHSLSYVIDVSRGTVAPLKNPVDFALYIALFPQLIAGPIVRFHEIRDQLTGRTESSELFAAGAFRFAHGLGKKVLIADTVAPIANAAFAAPAGELGAGGALIGALAYTVQIYFDFSGYSDMALGLGAMFGFRLPENFARPYSSRSITEFWRRWHMSLSRWFRDYLYVPLGGNRHGLRKTIRNLVIVFVITGFWHGANWTFLAWGAYHGSLLLIERLRGMRGDPADSAPNWIGMARTFGLVVAGWILFRSPDIGSALAYFGAFLDPGQAPPPALVFALDPLATICLLVGLASVLLPRDWVTGRLLWEAGRGPIRVYRPATLVLIFPVAVIFLVAGTFSPFLYFQF